MSRARAGVLAAALCVLAAGAVLPAGAGAWGNPANHPKLVNKPIEGEAYDHATKCRPRSTPGIRMLTRWIDRHFPGDNWGVWRCQSLSKDTKSLHSEGRALDWRLDAGRKRERRAANFLIQRLLAKDEQGNVRALARRMGVQEIIFNCRSWFSGSDGMGPYSACQGGRVDRTTAHKDHIHIALNKRGSKGRTSFWKSGLWRK
jgi:hypothetical protein